MYAFWGGLERCCTSWWGYAMVPVWSILLLRRISGVLFVLFMYACRLCVCVVLNSLLYVLVSFDCTIYIVKRFSIGMFVWAVKCGFISESKLCENLRRFHGSLLYQDVNL